MNLNQFNNNGCVETLSLSRNFLPTRTTVLSPGGQSPTVHGVIQVTGIGSSAFRRKIKTPDFSSAALCWRVFISRVYIIYWCLVNLEEVVSSRSSHSTPAKRSAHIETSTQIKKEKEYEEISRSKLLHSALLCSFC